MKTFYEDTNTLVEVDENSGEIVVTAKNSDMQDNKIYLKANAAGGISAVAPMSRWHPDCIDMIGGFWVWLN